MSPRASWILARDESSWRKAALAPLVPAAWVYGAAAAVHRGAFRRGPLHPTRLPIRVVSVGNLVVGGAAKTPTAAWIAAALHRRGHKVALASRGYGGRRSPDEGVVHTVSDGRFVRSRAEDAGDEPMLLAAYAPGVPVLVGRDRARVGLRAFAAFGAEVLVLDDGFHHHPLARDVDVVNFDGAFGFGNGHVLPRGPLRECVGALRFATAIGVIDGPLASADAGLVEAHAPDAYRFSAQRTPASVRPLLGGDPAPPETLDGASVGLLAGLARPDSLRRTLSRLGAEIVAERVFPDHHHYRPRDVRGLAREAPVWITTEKDALKITPDWIGRTELRVLSIDLTVDCADAFVDWLEERLGDQRANSR